MNKAVLFITFTRLDTTKEVFEKIKLAKPPRLYLASDGPKENKEGEKEKVEEIRNWLLKNVDWECEVKTRFLDKNSGGCCNGVSSAVTWFFENEKDGIILEDDCVPELSFFAFCENLLDKYKDNKKVWHISGQNVLEISEIKESYFFSTSMHCWGWASWADRWQYFRKSLKDYDEKNIKNFSSNKLIQKEYKKILDIMNSDNPIDTWDYQWNFMIAKHKGLCVISSRNMVKNIGYDGVHFKKDEGDSILNKSTYALDKIIHPRKVKCNNKETEKIILKNLWLENKVKKFSFKEFLQQIFSIKNEGKHKVLRILGIKIKIKRKYKE